MDKDINNRKRFKALYAAFDLYPSAKGAATHIYHMFQSLIDYAQGAYLFVLGNDRLPIYQLSEDYEIIRFSKQIENYLERAEGYSHALKSFIETHNELEIVHFRDIWSGLASINKGGNYKTVFELNAFTSIELPYRYPYLQKDTLKKIVDLEQFCLEQADKIICPANTIKINIIKRGINEDKIQVISNGADVNPSVKQIDDIPEKYILYFGALQIWQGVDVLLKAFAGLKDFEDLKLIICSSNRPSYTKAYRKLSEKLGIDNKIIWNYQLTKEELNYWIKNALLTVAPMKETERNINQGFSPLKVFESMVLGVPVVASDLPSIREIIQDNVNGKLVRPDRPADLSRAIRFLIDFEQVRRSLGGNAKKIIQKHHQWKLKQQMLKQLYQSLLEQEKTENINSFEKV